MTAIDGKPVPDAPMGRRPKRRQKIVLTVFLVVVVAFFGLIWFATRHNPEGAKVGDCVRQTGSDSVRVVGCADPAAAFRVVGRVNDRTEFQASLSACAPFADQGAEQFYWSGKLGKTGYVLCLARNR